MALKETYKHMRELLGHIVHDLEKSENGNKAASQRVVQERLNLKN